ncbi:hypothetical protein DSM104443_01013 [Usitatibacter rugosus]|uniref:Peptidase S9 prolyl oligopeptidase catalytic domain-containing protein n=1 Tax=Usitatibacter rugosus TaxID=2732067 RepID=A0A6M4GS85_9PROT|nr:S9 family peptidase [Usitatibacter rugosus]QJR09962.1 hypothetical protein DSM104443_01013 [Usitatibacter rugosus]
MDRRRVRPGALDVIRRLAAALVAGLAASASAAEPPSIESLFRLPQYSAMVLAPDGSVVAALAPVNGRQNLVLLDLGSRKATPVTSFEDVDVVAFDWVSSKRLLLRTGTLNDRDANFRGGDLIAIDRDGNQPYRLAERGRLLRMDLPTAAWEIPVRMLPGEGDDVILQQFRPERSRVAAGGLRRVNTRNGQSTPLSLDKPEGGEGERWLVDDNGVARAIVVGREKSVTSWYRSGAGKPWVKVSEEEALSAGRTPVAIDGDGLIVSVDSGRDKAALYRWSPETKLAAEPIAEHPRVDLRRIRFDQGTPVGVSYADDVPGTAWFDPAIRRVQEAMDKAMPGTVNDLSWSRDRKHFIVQSRSDVSPGAFYYFDATSGKLEWLADRSPWIKSAEMSHTRAVRYKARDGLEIPAYLTLPRGSDGKGLPLIVNVHGGPYVHGSTGMFDPETQFFASRGYAVLSPNFRGSTGYGWKHFQGGLGQWGLAMQDDLTDGVQWAIAQGIADPKRVCIYGASYGGYAAMMGVAKTPDLYRCAVNYVGVTDLILMLTATWSDYSDSDYARYIQQDAVGDVTRDRERLEKASPARQAAKITAPVLMAYGASDRRVPIEHGTKMLSALRAAGKSPEWIVMEGEGHGFRNPENVAAYYKAVEAFLAKHLKPAN